MTDVGVGHLVIDVKAQIYVVILGNTVKIDGTIWCADWETLTKRYCAVSDLRVQTDVPSPKWEYLLKRMEEKAESGNSDAMWWCGWAYEGMNHPRSVWFYIAALRRDPVKHEWARERVIDDARNPAMCNGIPDPDLSFLEGISELKGSTVTDDWRQAVAQARSVA